MPDEIVISPVTRIEGHAEITVELGDDGRAKGARFHVHNFRGFERFLEGMPADDLPQLTCRICGICYSAHGLASVKAIESAWGIKPSPEARKVRELIFFGQYIESHALSLAVLSLPDFIYPGQGPEKRNIVNLLKTHEDVAKKLIDLRQSGSMITRVVGGRPVHPVNFVPGGVVRVPTPEERKELLKGLEGKDAVLVGLWNILKEVLLKNPEFMSLGATETHYLAMNDEGKIAFYDGHLSIMTPDGKIKETFPPEDYFKHVAEEEHAFSYMKFPVLVTGEKFRVGPLARVNIAKLCGTPKADEILSEAREIVGFPTNTTMAYHVARLIETVYSWEKAVELLNDDDVSSPKALFAGIPAKAGRGIGIVEAPRGVLVHQYEFGDTGRLIKANFVVATQHNNHAINDGLSATARELITSPKVPEEILNRLEMIARAYDPCLACATHAIGVRPFTIELVGPDGKTIRRWERNGRV
ncbi:MAG: Ni/Fe hydrogenase subunit alpha [candidate division WOR-3 bacterium]